MRGCFVSGGLLGIGMGEIQTYGCDELDWRLEQLRAEILAIEREKSRCFPQTAFAAPSRRAARPDQTRAVMLMGSYTDAFSVSGVIVFGGPLSLSEVMDHAQAHAIDAFVCLRPSPILKVLVHGFALSFFRSFRTQRTSRCVGTCKTRFLFWPPG
jgi:hypothetical protein